MRLRSCGVARLLSDERLSDGATEHVVDCETPAIIFHLLGVDVNQRQNIFDCPAFAVLVFGHEVCDFDSCARVEVFSEDASDSTA